MNAPIWGNFVYYGDCDVLAFALLFQGGLHVTAYYHAAQAMEKYLKALALSIVDPAGSTHPFPLHKRWLNDHDLGRLAKRCKSQFPYYGEDRIRATLERFAEFDELTRYPWVEQTQGNGFTTADLPLICELLIHLRADVPLTIDDYLLGMCIRGHHHNHPDRVPPPLFIALHAPAVAAARQVIPNIDQMVRW